MDATRTDKQTTGQERWLWRSITAALVTLAVSLVALGVSLYAPAL